MAKDLRRVIARQFRPPRGFAERPAPRSNRSPRVIIHEDFFETDDQRVAALRALDPDRAGDGIGLRRRAIETRAQSRDGLVLWSLEITGACVPSLDLKCLAGLHAQERLVFPIEG